MTDQPKWTPGPWRATTHDHPEQGVYAGYRIAKMTGGEIQRDRANANLIAAAPDLYFGGEAQTDIIRHAQAILTQYLIPDGIDGPEAINQLLGLLDGPEQRAAQAAWDAALAKARGQA